MRSTVVVWTILGVFVPVLCGCGGSETESRPEPFTLWIVEYSI